jgi:hypothetical protein
MTYFDRASVRPLELDPEILARSFNREPFGFRHNLSGLDIFQPGSLESLAEKYSGHASDYSLASGATAPGQRFRSVQPVTFGITDAFAQLKRTPVRILLKRLENYDPRFRELRDSIVETVVGQLGGLKNDKIVRLFSSVFISSAKTLTPFHFDPSMTFFFQISGDKRYHVFPPAALHEPEVEQFYCRQAIDIAQVDLARRDPMQEHVYDLAAGKGFHQPQNAPHWVETREELSVSYTISFDTVETRRLGRTRGFNHYLRSLGMKPAAPGMHPRLDAFKASALGPFIPLRKLVRDVRSTVRSAVSAR